ncbi:putative molybdopterin binding domain protein [Asticcacaulis biprosthecium C19]|uniref:Putative molybdopterin binding domain protein n=1 Tax=Asticcacaulis biprosthecium C19 TaxID=715226 RepID=F4QRM0_9CAUL|nr:molybdopterin-binding protein [Asticcacaulis biprosthecium]EGF90146.1 putative molybdopterin binding domain protein [Asticcacaulis biprosthecium C19]
MSANPTAAILIIGDEILSGRTIDTNVNTIAKFLSVLGVDLMEVRMVHDDEAQIIASVNAVRDVYDYVFTTGGIGPTHDDITADCIAKAFDVQISEHPAALKLLVDRATKMGWELNENSRRMARIPHGAELIMNPVSAAPGFQLGNVFVMAGVPKIMTAMLEDVAPRLRTGRQVLSRTLKLSYVGESWAADVLRDIDSRYPDLSLGSYPYGLLPGEFGTHLVVRGQDERSLDAATSELISRLEPIVAETQLRQPLAALEEV